MNRAIKISFASLLSLAAGCATVPEDAGFKNVHSTIDQRTGQSIEWRDKTSSAAAIDAAVREILASELTAEQAVRVALLNNRNLQATYEDLGISQADVVQAGLLRNPVLDLSIRFPDRPPSKTDLDFSLIANFIDLLMLPSRKKLADDQFQATQMRVTHEVLELAARVKAAFYLYQSADQIAELRHIAADSFKASLDVARRLHDAGNMNNVDYTSERAQYARAVIDLNDVESDAMDLRERLNVLMGLWKNQIEWKAHRYLDEPPTNEIAPQGLESLAVVARLDLAAARRELIAQARAIGISNQFPLLSDSAIGIASERDTDGQWKTGPTFSVPLPIFDQGQASAARAQARFRQVEDRYLALAIEIRSEVRAARSKMFSARAKADFYHTEALPLAQTQLEQIQLQYNGMLVGVFQLLGAKREQIETGRQYVEALRDYWTARAELERAVGGRLPTTQPSTEHHHGDQP